MQKLYLEVQNFKIMITESLMEEAFFFILKAGL